MAFSSIPAAFFISMVMITVLLCSGGSHAATSPTEINVKTAYIYQIPKFITWPDGALQSPDRIFLCVWGTADEYEQALRKLHLRKVQNHSLHIRYINKPSQINDCNILFLTGPKARKFINKHYTRLTNNHILTIGEASGFAQYGGVIGFTLKDNRVGVEVNAQVAEDSGIMISANLLEIASGVYRHRTP